ncbi:M13 family metallopeptidase [Kordiimonas aquimaris]|uniref:M13 family metallopeptidase n=1 Tax=Kordiimonas aquimaris TaxID=707591 RepID=UPI0021D14F87|nr:M13 family metallopeptidase [Kordiimonas aquimaris]
MSMRKISIAMVLAGLVTGCSDEGGNSADTTSTDNTSSASAAPVIEPWGYPLDALDNNTRPQDDLFQFANGGWLAATQIPDDRSGVGFSQIMLDRNEERIKSIIEDLKTKDVIAGTNEQKIRDLHASYMHGAVINEAGITPLQSRLDMISAIEGHTGVAQAMMNADLGSRALFGLFVAIDSKNPSSYTVYASHAGTALPDKSYYERDSERLTALRVAYIDYMEAVFARLGHTDARSRAEAVFALEKAVASNHWTRAERRNADRTYNPHTIAELEAYAPGFPWEQALEAWGASDIDEIVLREKESFPALAQLFAETPVDVWKDYLTFHAMAAHAPFLSDDIAEERFAFFGTVLRGQKAQRSREERAIQYVNSELDQAVGKIYIDRFFPEESKVLVREMFENIRVELGERIDNLTWMSADTKVAARTKLAKINAKIAYPDTWRDYGALSVSPDSLFSNAVAIRKYERALNISRLGTTVDKDEWFSGPQTVNAFYSPSRNEAFIPAGYIQSPLFDPNADPALNYGALGSIIGHEIGHGFDDQGSKYDGDGVLQAWWNEEDRASFNTLGDGFAEQFSQYEPIPGLNVNGRQTLGENIGDLAGMIVAFHAWERSLGGEEAPVLDGFTGPQRFFLGRSQGRRYKRTEESLRQRLLSAPHSPMYLRVNGMARNMDEFYEAFDVQPGDAMYIAPENRVRIW